MDLGVDGIDVTRGSLRIEEEGQKVAGNLNIHEFY